VLILTEQGDIKHERIPANLEGLCAGTRAHAVDVLSLTPDLDMWIDDDGRFRRKPVPLASFAHGLLAVGRPLAEGDCIYGDVVIAARGSGGETVGWDQGQHTTESQRREILRSLRDYAESLQAGLRSVAVGGKKDGQQYLRLAMEQTIGGRLESDHCPIRKLLHDMGATVNSFGEIEIKP